jgi:hypothetical protein
LTRFANVPGRIIAINGNGLALVQFEGPDQGWHDIAPDFLRPEPPSEEKIGFDLKPVTSA